MDLCSYVDLLGSTIVGRSIKHLPDRRGFLAEKQQET
jgi:hypothetical protein